MKSVEQLISNLDSVIELYTMAHKQGDIQAAAKEKALELEICRNHTTFEFCMQYTQTSGKKVEYFQIEGYDSAMNLVNTYRKIGHAIQLKQITVTTLNEDENAKEYVANKVTFKYNDKRMNA